MQKPDDLADAMAALETSLRALEGATQRRLELEHQRGDLETELAIMQDDRARLAVDLDGAQAKLGALEKAAEHADQRLQAAISAIRGLLGEENG